MLQQTQVKTVIPYYRRFLKRFPTLQALDRAPESKVLALWSGLGYYRRAENLKRAARILMLRHGGKIPRDWSALRALPGVGRYTAGAIMSIAFKQPFPAVDGNARRVLRRLWGGESENATEEIARRLVSRTRADVINQALMELGATVCLPRAPRCPCCPVAASCAARKLGLEAKRASPRPRTRKIDWPLLIVQNGRRILLHQRPRGGLLSGLWELPGGIRKKEEEAEETLLRHLNGYGAEVKGLRLIGEIRHAITHHRIRAPVYTCATRKSSLPDPRWTWARISSLGRYPISSLSLKALALLTPR